MISVSDINDPEHIRVVIYVNGKTGHVPLNALLSKVQQDIKKLSKQQTDNVVQIVQCVTALEQKFETILKDFEDIKSK
ncbi:hypothetical protein [Bartonella sp. B41]